MPLGTVVTGVATIGDKQVPLLKGEWKIVQSSRSLGRASGAPLGGAVLVRMTGSKHRVIVSIRTNLDVARASGWKRPKSLCDRDNVHFNESDRNYNTQDAVCWQVNHYINTRSTKGSIYHQIWKQWLRDNLSTTSLVMLQYWYNDAYDYVWVTYLFDPTRFGFSPLQETKWIDSVWHRYAIKDDPRREGFIAAAKALGEKLHVLIGQGFRNKLDGYVADLDLEFSG